MKKLVFAKFVYESLKNHKLMLGALLISASYFAVHMSIGPYVFKLIIDALGSNQASSGVWSLLVLYLCLQCIFHLSFRLYEVVGMKLYPRLRTEVISSASKVINLKSIDFFQDQFSGTIAKKVQDLSLGLTRLLELTIEQYFARILGFIIACFTLYSINPSMAIILSIWFISMISLGFVLTKRGRKLATNFQLSGSSLAGTLVDSLANTVVARLFTNSSHENNILYEKLSETESKDKSLRKYFIVFNLFTSLMTLIMMGSCLYILINSYSAHSASIGDFGLVLMLTVSISDAVWLLSRNVGLFSEYYGQIQQTLYLLESGDEIKDAAEAHPLVISDGSIRFNQVSFRHKDANSFLFQNLSFQLPQGARIGLVGYSGSGKSTFVKLILRLFDPVDGQISIDGQDISDVTQESLHRAISYIPQEPLLFHRTVYDNISYGDLTASPPKVIEASRRAFAHDFIEKLPQGYNTIIGDGGIKLSGGQRQRLAIARAFLKNSSIFILDEATSSQDSITESYIKDNFWNLVEGKTTITIAHRLSTLQKMDLIMVFDDGRVIDSGSHEELISTCQVYQKLWNTQYDGLLKEAS